MLLIPAVAFYKPFVNATINLLLFRFLFNSFIHHITDAFYLSIDNFILKKLY